LSSQTILFNRYNTITQKIAMNIIIPSKSEIAQYAPPSNSEIAEFAREAFERQKKHEREMTTKYGYVKPIISLLHKGVRIVAVKNRVHWSPSWKTVPDFLFDYIVFILGRDWFINEFNKPQKKRHINQCRI